MEQMAAEIGGEAASRNRTCAQAKESQKRDGQRLQEDREISQAEQDCVEQVLLLTDSLFERGGAAAELRKLVEKAAGLVRSLKVAILWMRAFHEVEIWRSSNELRSMQSTITSPQGELKELCKISNSEQPAEANAEDFVRAEEKIKSLEVALAAVYKKIMSAEEWNKMALLLQEEDSNVARLETKLKDTEDWVTKLQCKHAAASDAAESLRKANERLSSDLASLTAEFKLEKERQGNKIDGDSQTEGILKVDCATITQEAGEDILSKNEKLTAEVSMLNTQLKKMNTKLLFAFDSHDIKYSALEKVLYKKQEQLDFLKREVKRLSNNAGGPPPLHKRQPAQAAAEKPTPVTKPGELASKVLSPFEAPPISSELLTPTPAAPAFGASAAHTPKAGSSTDNSEQALDLTPSRGSKLSLSALSSAVKRTSKYQEKAGDHPTSSKSANTSPPPPSAQSATPHSAARKRKFFMSTTGYF